MSLHFPLQKIRTFRFFTLPVSPFTERSPLWRWNSQWVHTFHCQKCFRPLRSPSFKWQLARAARRVIENPRQMIKSCPIGSAKALPILCVRYFRWEREREREREREGEIQRERERRKWRHCRAKIGDEFSLSLAKNSHNWRWAYTFPCQSTNQEGVRSVQRTDLCFAICRFSQVRFITPSHLTHNLFFYFQ